MTGNTQRVWTLYGVVLTLNCLNADEQMTAAERHGIVKGTAELNQPRYFRDVLTLKWKSKNVLHWGRGYAFVSTGNERLWIPSRLIDTRFDWGRPP